MMRLLPLLSLSVAMATGLSFTFISEWDDSDLKWTPEYNMSKTYKRGASKPYYMAVFGQRVFVSFSRYYGIPVTLAWLPIGVTTSFKTKLNPFPSWQMQEERNCRALQSVRGLEIDSVGRLWAVDQGTKGKCPPKLWIFHLAQKDSLELEYEFPDSVVSRTETWLTDLAVDETPEDAFAYVANHVGESMQLIAFSLKRKTTWRVEIADVQFEALAISRFEDRKYLYISGFNTSGIYAVDLSHIRKGNVNPAFTLVGNKMAPSRRMVFDGINGMIYFDQQKTGSVGTLDLITLKEELVFKDTRFVNYWPFLLAFNYPKTLFMMVGDTIGDEKKYRLYKAEVKAKSLSRRDCIMMTGRGENEANSTRPKFQRPNKTDITQGCICPEVTCDIKAGSVNNHARDETLLAKVLILTLTCLNAVILLTSTIILCLFPRRGKVTIKSKKETVALVSQHEVQSEKHQRGMTPPDLYERPRMLLPSATTTQI